MILAFLLGVLTWSLMEYSIHRWLGHDRRLVKKTPFGVEHTAHHSRGNYFAPSWKKAAATLLFSGVVAPPAIALAETATGIAYTAGLVGFYLVYEVLHRLLHVWAGVGPYARWARRHHFYHHFHDPRLNHGVTSPLWDWVFGTYRRPERIAVPKKLAMRWLLDPASGQVRDPLLRDYSLRG
ncbi:MAG: hypothetical protein EP329_18485 [Deltaproteobacteria bacterium]|nr:MAG: hypothetical protein EP329_18485 [Deltaproteobacteria bacterium]